MQNNKQPSYYLLALKLLKGVGDVTACKLLDHFQDAKAIFQADQAELKALSLKASIVHQIKQFDFTLLEPLLAWASQDDCFIIELGSHLYPPLLTEIHTPPLVLFVRGKPELLLSAQIAVVGSRSPSSQGLENTRNFCQALGEQGLTITSGMAMGIDGEAHRAALANNKSTIAIMGTGLNRVYPPLHRELAHQIAEKGALVSESLPDESHHGGSFSRRNRIIAGLSLGTLVIEAAAKSGTLITARHSMEEGREVYAVPGSIHSPLSKGCHQLIKQGAKLVESIEDIIEDLPACSRSFGLPPIKESRTALSEEDALFLSHIDYETTSIDSIVTRSQLTVEAVTNKLLALELEGWVINSVGGYIRQ